MVLNLNAKLLYPFPLSDCWKAKFLSSRRFSGFSPNN